MAKFRGLIFFASWRLGWTILIWLFIIILIVLLFRCLRTLAESAGAYLETALDHYGFPVSRLQGQREQDICRANRELQVPTPNIPPAISGPGTSTLWSNSSRISPEPSRSEENRLNQNRNSTTSLPASPSWFNQVRSTVVPDDRPPDYDQLRISVPSRSSFPAVVSLDADNQHNQRNINSLDVNHLEAATSPKALDEEVEPPPYESLFPEEDNQCLPKEQSNRRDEQRQ